MTVRNAERRPDNRTGTIGVNNQPKVLVRHFGGGHAFEPLRAAEVAVERRRGVEILCPADQGACSGHHKTMCVGCARFSKK